MQHQEWYIERERLLGRIKELEAENAELRKRLGEDVTPIEKTPTAMQNLSLQEKVDLFRSLSSTSFPGSSQCIWSVLDVTVRFLSVLCDNGSPLTVTYNRKTVKQGGDVCPNRLQSYKEFQTHE